MSDSPIWYTGVGSRRAPLAIVKRCTALAILLQKLGLSLRTGDAVGCDSAFRLGAGGAVRRATAGLIELEAPNGTLAHVFKPCDEIGWRLTALRACLDYGEDFARRPISHRQLLLRNMPQVVGKTGDDPSDFLIYWSPVSHAEMIDRSVDRGGGTRYAVRRAHLSDVPCFHLSEKTDEQIARFARQCLRKRSVSGTIAGP